MKKKQHDLLKYLLSQSKPITSTEIANALSISTRSVKNYVSDINSHTIPSSFCPPETGMNSTVRLPLF